MLLKYVHNCIIIHFQFTVDTTTCVCAAPFWYSGSNATAEHSNLVGTTESEHSEIQAVCPTNPKDKNGTYILSGGLSDGSWKNSMNLLHELAEAKKYVIHPSVMPEYNSPVSSRASNSLVKDQIERGKRSETSTGFRLFGIDLRNSNIPSPAKEVKDSFNVADSNKQASSVAQLEADRAEKKKVLLEAIEEETRNKHGSCASKRTRTKVARHTLLIF